MSYEDATNAVEHGERTVGKFEKSSANNGELDTAKPLGIDGQSGLVASCHTRLRRRKRGHELMRLLRQAQPRMPPSDEDGGDKGGMRMSQSVGSPDSEAEFRTKHVLVSTVRSTWQGTYMELLESDRLEFERKLKDLRLRLEQKKKSLGRLLGYFSRGRTGHGDIGECINGRERPSVAKKRKSGHVESMAAKGNGCNNKKKKHFDGKNISVSGESKKKTDVSYPAGLRDGNPYRDAIVLLRGGTPRVEQAVSNLVLASTLDRNVERNKNVAKGIGDEVHSEIERVHVVCDEIDDVCADNIGNAFNRSRRNAPVPTSSYLLASRVVQEDGEELEIFERCDFP